jgi:hypothetical protein
MTSVPAKPMRKIRNAFNTQLKYFTEAPILWHFERIGPIVIETDANDSAIGTVVSKVIDG